MAYDWNRWPAQQPPADFADRTVAAMLGADRVARRRSRRWFIPCAVAALLFGSAAWAMLAQERAEAPEPTPSAEPPVFEVAPAPLPTQTVAAPRSPEPESPPLPAVARPRPATTASSSAPASKPDAGNFVVHPRCICEHGTAICSCVE